MIKLRKNFVNPLKNNTFVPDFRKSAEREGGKHHFPFFLLDCKENP